MTCQLTYKHATKVNLHVFKNRQYKNMFQRPKKLEHGKKLKASKSCFFKKFVNEQLLLS